MDKVILHEQGKYKPIDFGRPMPDDNWPYPHRPVSPNDPNFGIKAPKFERHIFISRDQIFYDIDSQISIVSGARRKGDGTEDDTLSNATTTYKQQFFRWIDKHIGIAKNKMQTFVLEQFKTTKMNSISQVEEVDITLLMPEWWDDTIFDQLVQAVHDYIVNAVLQEYFIITLTSKDPVTVDKGLLAATSLDEIKKLSNSAKPGRIKKNLAPF